MGGGEGGAEMPITFSVLINKQFQLFGLSLSTYSF